MLDTVRVWTDEFGVRALQFGDCKIGEAEGDSTEFVVGSGEYISGLTLHVADPLLEAVTFDTSFGRSQTYGTPKAPGQRLEGGGQPVMSASGTLCKLELEYGLGEPVVDVFWLFHQTSTSQVMGATSAGGVQWLLGVGDYVVVNANGRRQREEYKVAARTWKTHVEKNPHLKEDALLGWRKLGSLPAATPTDALDTIWDFLVETDDLVDCTTKPETKVCCSQSLRFSSMSENGAKNARHHVLDVDERFFGGHAIKEFKLDSLNPNYAAADQNPQSKWNTNMHTAGRCLQRAGSSFLDGDFKTAASSFKQGAKAVVQPFGFFWFAK